MTRLFVDDRYRGAHGIARYAREVVPRLGVAWTALGLSGSPHTPLDAFRTLPDDVRKGAVYSPGYGALVRAGCQVLTIHDLIQLRLRGPRRAAFAAYYAGPVRHAVRRAGVVLTVSETSSRDIRAWVRDDDVEVVNAGNGCSAAFRPDGEVLRSDIPYVLFVGNLRAHKNVDVLLRALAAGAQGTLRAVVPAGEADALRARAGRRGVADRVVVESAVTDDALAAMYRGAAATAMPSIDEGFGLPALESIACGVPVLYWRGCEAVAEVVGGCGEAVSSARDAEEWADAMTRAVASPVHVEPPVSAHDWERTARVVSSVLERCLT